MKLLYEHILLCKYKKSYAPVPQIENELIQLGEKVTPWIPPMLEGINLENIEAELTQKVNRPKKKKVVEQQPEPEPVIPQPEQIPQVITSIPLDKTIIQPIIDKMITDYDFSNILLHSKPNYILDLDRILNKTLDDLQVLNQSGNETNELINQYMSVFPLTRESTDEATKNKVIELVNMIITTFVETIKIWTNELINIYKDSITKCEEDAKLLKGKTPKGTTPALSKYYEDNYGLIPQQKDEDLGVFKSRLISFIKQIKDDFESSIILQEHNLEQYIKK